jgi:hypothetical protein
MITAAGVAFAVDAQPRTKVSNIRDLAINKDIAQVRIPIVLQPYESVQIKGHNGTVLLQQKPGAKLEFTLRGQINQPNHFYFANWRVETEPTMWKQDLRQYGVRLSVYKTIGERREFEEKIGSFEVNGVLMAQGDRVYNFVAKGEAEFKTPEGKNLLSMTAGQSVLKQQDPSTKAISKLSPAPSNP